MSNAILNSAKQELERIGPELSALLDQRGDFCSLIKDLTTKASLELGSMLEQLRKWGDADAVLLMSRVSGVNREKTIGWRCVACGCVANGIKTDQWQQLARDEVFWKLLDTLCQEARCQEARSKDEMDAQAEFTPSWCSELVTANDKTANEELRQLEGKFGLSDLEKKTPSLGPVCVSLIGHVMIGGWHVGETLLVLAQTREQHHRNQKLFGNLAFYIPVFLTYLAELERHLSRKANIDQKSLLNRKAFLDDRICAAAYVRSICRLAPLWREHPEVEMEARPGITMENLAYVKKMQKGGQNFSGGFTVEKAVAALATLEDHVVALPKKGV